MLAPLTDTRPDGIVFLGTPDTAARSLALILESGVRVDLVVTADAIVRIVPETDKNADKNGMIAVFAEDELIQKKN